MRLADLLTLGRAVASPPIAGLIVARSAAALPLFAIAATTDLLDGAIARRRGPTPRGASWDPLADKTLVLLSLAALVAIGRAPLYALAAIAVRELGISWLRRTGGGRTVDASGKAKTTLQMVAIGALLVPGFGALADALLAGAVLLTLLTGVRYATRARAV